MVDLIICSMYKLQCTWQNYAWGKLGDSSEVAAIVGAGEHCAEVAAEKPFAELWMGVHPNGPSSIRAELLTLEAKLKSNPHMLSLHENGTLQFLFKVLSVGSALSVQTHPTKKQAALLHSMDPKNYPDANHKPEMAIALTDFQLLCGFRPPTEIYANLLDNVELHKLLAAKVELIPALLSAETATQENALREIFTHIWNIPQAQLTTAIAELIERYKLKEEKSALDQLLIRLDKEYPGGDVGVFAPLFLNYFTLSPGEATFLGPNRPHAYLFGDCIECMACSDNTIRAGLTPKYKDIATLCANMEYSMSGPPRFPFAVVADGIRLYAPPVPEFAVEEIKSAAVDLPNIGSSALIIVVRGSARFSEKSASPSCTEDVKRGDVIFQSANLLQIHIQNASPDFFAFRAYTPKPLHK